MEQSPRGEDSYNGTPTSGMKETRHLEEIHEEDVEMVPQQVFTTAKKTTTARTTGDRASWSIPKDKAIVSSYINGRRDTKRNTNTRKVGLWNV